MSETVAVLIITIFGIIGMSLFGVFTIMIMFKLVSRDKD